MTITDLIQEKEGSDYATARFQVNGKKIIYRQSKVTPTKIGQFVTTWKRNSQGITEPFHVDDDFNYLVVHAAKEKEAGLFIFPKAILTEQAVISSNNKNGKRGTRVYLPWDTVTSKQAIRTQEWQVRYFIDFSDIENGKGLLPEIYGER